MHFSIKLCSIPFSGQRTGFGFSEPYIREADSTQAVVKFRALEAWVNTVDPGWKREYDHQEKADVTCSNYHIRDG